VYPSRTKDTEYLNAPILKPYRVVMTADIPAGTDVNASPDINPALDVTPKENPRGSLATNSSAVVSLKIIELSKSLTTALYRLRSR
tara:strand:+ start:148 stop:405 length:258 start_codon:yes stop_codon:yes gene_type:complete